MAITPIKVSRLLARLFAWVAVVILIASTVFWSLLGAKVELGNADQLIDPYLFSDRATFHAATFPAAHSFLIKWPLFWLVHLTGSSAAAFTTITVMLSVLTVASLAFILYRIERRPLIFGTLCLALTSVLLLVPIQSYAGALLPVNLAMLTTRNIEYIVYIASLVLILRSFKVRNWQFWLAVLCLGLLMASDKLFMLYALGSASLALVVYALVNNWKLVSISVRWLVGSILAVVLAVVLVTAINASGFTHITASSDSPYGLDLQSKDVVLGTVYAGLSMLTNFGANPAYDATILRQIPHQAMQRLWDVSGPTFIINVLIFVAALFAMFHVARSSLLSRKSNRSKLDVSSTLAALLLTTVLTALAAYIFTNHYYAVDARYLTIGLFAGFVALATYSRSRKWRLLQVQIVAAVLLLGIVLAMPGAVSNYTDNNAALSDTNNRNTNVSEVLKHRPVDKLVGDYWRVTPTKLVAHGAVNITPLSDCTQPQTALSSQAWQSGWQTHSFAYLLSLDKGLTGYPGCTLTQVTTAYGRPNGSVLTGGTLSHPKEFLLFYDHGVNKPSPTAPEPRPPITTVTPITLDQLTGTVCDGPSTMNIVAHQDDDLLFMNPDLMRDLQAGYCVRTVYITAGDAGAGSYYWLSRERGSQAAYDEMDGPTKDTWVDRTVELPSHQFVTISNPKGNKKISLIFMHLPDGNVHGEGFKTSNFESLEKLKGGSISHIKSIDGQSSYTSSELINALVSLMHTYTPSEFRTQAPHNMSNKYPDHSDHLAVGQFVQTAYAQYEREQYADSVTIPVKYYIGYPIHQSSPNVGGADLQQKQAAFFAYAKYDGSVCGSADQCAKSSVYGTYLQRQYQAP